MADNTGSKDKSLEILDFIINVLKEHEISLDKTTEALSTIVEQVGKTTVGLKSKVEESEEKINSMQKDVANLIDCLSSAPKKDLRAEGSYQEPRIQAAPVLSLAVGKNEPTLILHCDKWSDFENLAVRAKRVSFNYKEDEKIFQANAFMGNQMIVYSGALPNLSMILKKWLSHQLEINEKDILEGFLDKSN